jgi:peptidoglycan DL-endopeptidase CwlO
MASHRAPKKSGRAAAYTVLGVTAGSVALVPGISEASPQLTFDQVKTEVNQLNVQAEVSTQEYDAAQSTYAQLQKKVDGLQAQITQEQGTLNTLQASMGLQAAAQYRNNGVSSTLQLVFSKSPDTYLSDATIASQTAQEDAVQLKAINVEKAQLAADKASAASALAEEQAALSQAAASKTKIEGTLHKAQSLLSQLTAAQQVAIQQSYGSTTTKAALPAVSGRAGIAVAYAKSKLGDAYVWGATGPGNFDCSGLTMESWAAAGVDIPRTSEEQQAGLPSVPLADVQPGDLIFYLEESDGPAHVAIYVGDGMIIQAPHTGADVSYAPMYESGMEPAAAARP